MKFYQNSWRKRNLTRSISSARPVDPSQANLRDGELSRVLQEENLLQPPPPPPSCEGSVQFTSTRQRIESDAIMTFAESPVRLSLDTQNISGKNI